MTHTIDDLTLRLNGLVKKNFQRLEREQSADEGLKARQSRRDAWTLQNSIYTANELEGQRREAEKYEFVRYKG